MELVAVRMTGVRLRRATQLKYAARSDIVALVHPEHLSKDVVAVFCGVLNSRIRVISTSGDVMNDVLLSIVNFERVRFVVDHHRPINHCVSLIKNRREHLVADVNQCARMRRNLWSLRPPPQHGRRHGGLCHQNSPDHVDEDSAMTVRQMRISHEVCFGSGESRELLAAPWQRNRQCW